ncbi:MAG: Rpn family recombination-promoting nuclease/putative transposase [Lachnospiraceae bacterium]|nr:Rpn family recombination-promoting nuclease/putative transposase [Lachnospiraceae bacterium]
MYRDGCNNPTADRVFKLILTDPGAKPGLIKLISAIIGRNVVDVTLYPNEPPPGSTEEKAERLDINCKIDDGSQVNLDYSDLRIIPIIARRPM